MPKVSVKEFQRRIAELDSQYTVAQPRRPRLFGSIFALIVLALIAVAVFANIHRYTSDGFTQLTLKQGTTTPKHQLSDAETQGGAINRNQKRREAMDTLKGGALIAHSLAPSSLLRQPL
jgi:hypothetical protein